MANLKITGQCANCGYDFQLMQEPDGEYHAHCENCGAEGTAIVTDGAPAADGLSLLGKSAVAEKARAPEIGPKEREPEHRVEAGKR